MLPMSKLVKFANRYYTGILGVPHWPSMAFDHMVAKGGLNMTASGTPLKSQIDSVILAITQRCTYKCKHCYEYQNLAEEDSVPIERWKEVIKELQKIGVSIIVFSGGEPMLRYSGVMELLESGDQSLSDFHIHTSGYGLTSEKAFALKKGGIDSAGIGLDDFDPDRHDKFRGYQGAYKEAIQAIEHCHQAGIFTYTNVCLRKELVSSGNLWKYSRVMKDLNVGAILLLEPTPYGGYFFEDVDSLFSEEDKKVVTEFFFESNKNRKFKNFPYVSYMAYFESADRFGCLMGGLSHLSINSLGDVQPCVFLPVSFGNIMKEDFLEIFKRMKRAVPGPLHKECPAITLAEEIRGKKNQAKFLPIPYVEIENEWQRIFNSSSSSDF